MWQLINEEAGKFPSYDQKTELKTERNRHNTSAKANKDVGLLFCRNCS